MRIDSPTNLQSTSHLSGSFSGSFNGSVNGTTITADSTTSTTLAGDGGSITGIDTANITVRNNTPNISFTEQVEDIVGGMVAGNSEAGMSVAYQDSDGTLDFSNTDRGSSQTMYKRILKNGSQIDTAPLNNSYLNFLDTGGTTVTIASVSNGTNITIDSVVPSENEITISPSTGIKFNGTDTDFILGVNGSGDATNGAALNMSVDLGELASAATSNIGPVNETSGNVLLWDNSSNKIIISEVDIDTNGVLGDLDLKTGRGITLNGGNITMLSQGTVDTYVGTILALNYKRTSDANSTIQTNANSIEINYGNNVQLAIANDGFKWNTGNLSNYDFRLECNSYSRMFFMDAGNSQIHMGRLSDTYDSNSHGVVTIYNTSTSGVNSSGGTSNTHNLVLHSTRANALGNRGGSIAFVGGITGQGSVYAHAYISSHLSGGDTDQCGLEFGVHSSTSPSAGNITGAQLHHDGDFLILGTLTENVSFSDRRLKENITAYSGSLNKLMNIDIKSFTWKSEKLRAKMPGTRVGFIAQDISGSFPDVVREVRSQDVWFQEDDDINDETHLVADRDQLVPYLIQAIQELKAEIDELKSQI